MSSKSWLSNRKNCIEDFGNTNDIDVNANCTISLDSSNKKTGNYSLKITCTNAGQLCIITKDTISWTTVDTSIISFWLYIDDISKISTSGFNIYLSDDNFSNYRTAGISWYSLKSGWNLVKFQASDFSESGTYTYANTHTYFRINFTAATSQTPIVNIDTISLDWKCNAYVLTIWDDGFQSVRDKIYPYYKANNQRYTVGVVSSLIGYTGYISEETIKDMYKEGFDFVNHTKTHTNLTTLNTTQMLTEIGDCKDYLSGLNIERANNFFIYPQNAYNDDVITVLGNLGYEYARAGKVSEQQLPFDNQMIINTMEELDNATDTAKIEECINEVVAKGGICVFYGHKIVDSGASTQLEVNLSVAQHIVDYAKTTGVNVITASDLIKINENTDVLSTGNAGETIDGKDYIPSNDYLIIRPYEGDQLMILNLYGKDAIEIYMSNDSDDVDNDVLISTTMFESGIFQLKHIITNDRFLKIKNITKETIEIGYSGIRIKSA